MVVSITSCHKDHSLEGANFNKVDSLSINYPFAKGFCSLGGAFLGISIIDTVYFRDSLPSLLPDSLLLDMPEAGDQGRQGSCTAWATIYAAGTYTYHNKTAKNYSDTGNLSPAYTYNQITKGNCICTSFLDHLYLLKTQGASVLRSMPYDPSECIKQPDSLQTENAMNYKISGWEKVNLHNIELIKRAINKKRPVLFAITPDEGFNHLQYPYVWNKHLGTSNDSHALVITGYSNSRNAFRIMNSWGNRWADNGFAWIDYSFFLENVIEGGYIIDP